MISGYFTLGGGIRHAPDLPVFSHQNRGNHLLSRDRGAWALDIDLPTTTVNIPSRDKQVQLWSSEPHLELFAAHMGRIDAEYENQNYRSKLDNLASLMPKNFQGFINNINTDTHGSLAYVSNVPIGLVGLQDTQAQTSYLVWSTDPEFINSVLEAEPLRFLVYRFPTMWTFFLPSEAICSKWWRWTKANSTLHAFNALERRISGAS